MNNYRTFMPFFTWHSVCNIVNGITFNFKEKSRFSLVVSFCNGKEPMKNKIKFEKI